MLNLLLLNLYMLIFMLRWTKAGYLPLYESEISLICYVLKSVKNSIYDNCKNTYPYSLAFPMSQRVILP